MEVSSVLYMAFSVGHFASKLSQAFPLPLLLLQLCIILQSRCTLTIREREACNQKVDSNTLMPEK